MPYAVSIIVPMSKHAQPSFPLTVITNGCTNALKGALCNNLQYLTCINHIFTSHM